MSESALLIVRDCWKTFDQQPVLKGINLEVHAGEIVALLGPSGCGKSTLLRIIAGLETLDRGDVLFEGKSIVAIPPHERGFGLMFQDWALFPHKNVGENIGFGLKMQKQSPQNQQQRIVEMLELVGLQGYAKRRIFELSGGEKQRVALARALAPNPRLLMLDEPLGALDQTLRERLTLEIRDIIKAANVTAITVTHDHNEAWRMADQVVLMSKGTIVQKGTPEELYQQPANVSAARFLQLTNLVPVESLKMVGSQTIVTTAIGEFTLNQGYSGDLNPSNLFLLIHPMISTEVTPYFVEGTIERIEFRGGIQKITIVHDSGVKLAFDLTTNISKHVGERISIPLQPTRLTLID